MEAAARREFEQTALPLLDNLYGAAMRLTRDPAEAEDLVQDSMVRAYRFWDSFKQGTNIKAWMFTILRNTFINGYHRRGRARSFHSDVNAQMRSLGPTVALANSTSQPPGPEEALSTQITTARIREALDSLPPDYRTAVTLADLEGLSYKEIAEVMDCPIGTVMSRIYRGRKTLHKLLYEHAREIGIVEDGDPPAGERETKYTRIKKRSGTADEEDDDAAVDLQAYRQRKTNA
jgi:RNA polymerase sigma-70 factor, ECF subfamily